MENEDNSRNKRAGLDLKSLKSLNLLHGEKEFEQTHKQLEEISLGNIEADEEFAAEQEAYLIKLENELEKLKLSEMREEIDFQNYKLRSDLLDEEMEHDHLQSEHYMEENRNLEASILHERKKNSHIHLNFEESSIIDKIFSTIAHKDLTVEQKFKKQIMENRGDHVFECIEVLRGQGGNYLKRQTSILYFLHLMKERYTHTKIPIEDKEINTLFRLIERPGEDKIKTFENKIKVIYENDSFLINLDNDEKKKCYLMKDLKEEACSVFSIPKENRHLYHIVNDKLFVYSANIKVWDIHKQAIERNKSTLTWAHMELLDKLSIVTDRKNKLNKDSDKPTIAVEQEKVKQNPNKINSDNTFYSEIEEYYLMYVRYEALTTFFKKDKELEDIHLQYKNNIKKLEEKHKKDTENVFYAIDDSDNQQIILNAKYKEQLENEQIKRNENVKNHINKPLKPIYLSQLNVHYLRLFNFWSFVFSVLMAFSFFFFMNWSGSIDINQTYKLNTFLNSIFIFNPLYKQFLRDKEALKSHDFQNMIRTKEDISLWLDIVFNNLVMDSGYPDNTLPEGADTYNNFFQRYNTIYEVLQGINLNFKFSQPISKSNDSTFFELPKNITETFMYYNEFRIEREETAPQPFNKSEYNIDLLTPYEKDICSKNCFSKGEFVNQPGDNTIAHTGQYSYYNNGGYSLNLNNLNINRTAFNELNQMIKNTFLFDPQLRMFLLSFNVLHLFYQSVIKFEILFEFSTIGDTKVTINTDVLDTGSNTSGFYAFLYYSVILQIIIFVISVGVRFFSSAILLATKKKTKISFISIIYDTILILLMIFLMLNNQNLNSNIDSVLINGIFNDIKQTNYTLSYEYKDFDSMFVLLDINKQLGGIICLMLFFKILFGMTASPSLNYIITLGLKTIKNSYNILVILTMFILSYSLILHVMLGSNHLHFSLFSQSFLIALTSVLGNLDTSKYGDLYSVQLLIIIAILIILKFTLFNFIFAVIKQTYDKLRKEYKSYKASPHFKLVGDRVFLFFKYMLVPVNFYFMVSDVNRIRQPFKDLDLEKFVSEEINYRK